jgi:DNA-binding GntR family transcriptional regulator
MAADPRVGERVYADIKQAILDGELRLRQRLDIEALAKRTRASATPVRQALAILTAERLVRIDGARGYQVAFWSERELAELYEWRWRLAALAAASCAPQAMALSPAERRNHREAYAALMRRLAANANAEVRRASEQADERLHAALRAEDEALDNVRDEIAEVSRAMRSGGRALQLSLRRYFRRRIAKSGQIRAKAHANALPNNGA